MGEAVAREGALGAYERGKISLEDLGRVRARAEAQIEAERAAQGERIAGALTALRSLGAEITDGQILTMRLANPADLERGLWREFSRARRGVGEKAGQVNLDEVLLELTGYETGEVEELHKRLVGIHAEPGVEMMGGAQLVMKEMGANVEARRGVGGEETEQEAE